MEFEDQEEYDQAQLCRWCGAECTNVTYCHSCGRKVKRDLEKSRYGRMDAYDVLGSDTGKRIRIYERNK